MRIYFKLELELNEYYNTIMVYIKTFKVFFSEAFDKGLPK